MNNYSKILSSTTLALGAVVLGGCGSGNFVSRAEVTNADKHSQQIVPKYGFPVVPKYGVPATPNPQIAVARYAIPLCRIEVAGKVMRNDVTQVIPVENADITFATLSAKSDKQGNFVLKGVLPQANCDTSFLDIAAQKEINVTTFLKGTTQVKDENPASRVFEARDVVLFVQNYTNNPVIRYGVPLINL